MIGGLNQLVDASVAIISENTRTFPKLLENLRSRLFENIPDLESMVYKAWNVAAVSKQYNLKVDLASFALKFSVYLIVLWLCLVFGKT